MSTPKAPKHLSAEMKQFWAGVNEDFELQSDAVLILRCACENFDLAQEAREMVKKEGLTTENKRHPAIDVEKQAYSLFLRSMRALGLDIIQPGPLGRPPGR